MKSTISTLALAAGLAYSATGQAAVTYSFLSPFYAEFQLTVATQVTSDQTFAASAMTQCWRAGSPCDNVTFYMNAEAAGLGPKPDWQVIGVTSQGATSYSYFPSGTFQTEGFHAGVYGAQYDSLNVIMSAVPEPASLALLFAGLGLVGAWLAVDAEASGCHKNRGSAGAGIANRQLDGITSFDQHCNERCGAAEFHR